MDGKAETVNLTKPSVVIPEYSRGDFVGVWRVDLSMPPAKFLTELKTDGTYKGNQRTGKWWIEGTNITLAGFNGGQDYSLSIRNRNKLEGPIDGFQFWR